jgi:hypothetical protein
MRLASAAKVLQRPGHHSQTEPQGDQRTSARMNDHQRKRHGDLQCQLLCRWAGIFNTTAHGRPRTGW